MDKKIKTNAPASSASETTLEAALEQLDGILERMENGGLPLEKLLEDYETGARLVKFCQDRLEAAEKRIQVVSKTLEGEVHLEDFEAEELSEENES